MPIRNLREARFAEANKHLCLAFSRLSKKDIEFEYVNNPIEDYEIDEVTDANTPIILINPDTNRPIRELEVLKIVKKYNIKSKYLKKAKLHKISAKPFLQL